MPSRIHIFILSLLPALLPAAEPVTRIACGSCYKPKSDKGVFKTILAEQPDVFLFMGDNIYGDTEDMAVLKEKYNDLLRQPGFASLAKSVPILATWDDHDYGLNDAGRGYSKRSQSQQVFLDTFNFASGHPARKTPGIYHSRMMGPEGKRTQFILLDTRFFRSGLEKKRINGRNTYAPSTGPDATMLGSAQWAWLAAELKKPADLRVLVSSIQVMATDHRFEKWANMPDERNRFFELLKKSNCGPTILLSGDRHLAEVARLKKEETGLPFDLYEMTSSGMTHAGAPDDPSPTRVEGTYYRGKNFGLLDVDWSGKTPSVTLNIKGSDGKTITSTKVGF